MQSDREKLKTAGVALIWIASAIVHQTIGLIGIPVLSTFLVFTLISIAHSFSPTISDHLASKLLTQVPGFPIQAAVGLLAGFLIGRFPQRKIILWVWVLPLILYCVALLFPPINGSSLFGPYYPPEAHHKSTLLEQLSWSILFIPSAAYALGAHIAKPRWKKLP